MDATLLIAPSEDVLRIVLPEGHIDARSPRPLVSALGEGSEGGLRVAVSKLPDPRTAAVLRSVGTGPRDVDAVVLSVLPDIRDRDVSPAETERNLVEIARHLHQGAECHLFVLNGSSFAPGDEAHRWAGPGPEPLALRTHRFNIAVIRAALHSGLSVIDVDNLVAEAGGARHVAAPFHYSAVLHRLIRQELAQTLRMRLLTSRAAGLFTLVVPRYDRRVSEVVVTRWHKRPGEWIKYGEPLLDVRADDVSWRVEVARVARNGRQPSTGRSLGLVVNSGHEGLLRETVVAEGSTVRVGERIGFVSAGPEVPLLVPDDRVGIPSFPATATPLAWQAEAVVN